MGHKRVELDPVLEELRPLGFHQVSQCLLFFIGYFAASYQLFSIVFTGQTVSNQCAPPANISERSLLGTGDHSDDDNATSITYGKCDITVVSNVSGVTEQSSHSCLYGNIYDDPKEFSFVSEFDLVCDRAAMAGFTQTMFMLGQGIGATLFPILSDRFGRKRIQIITQALMLVGGVVLGVASEYWTFSAFKVFVGAVQQGVILTTVTANVESFPGKYRGFIAGFGGAIWWAIVTSTFVPFTFAFKGYSWRTLQLAMSGLSAVVIVQIFFLHEPLRWLLANGRTHQVVSLLEKAAKQNKRDVKAVLDVFHTITHNAHRQDANGNDGVIIKETGEAGNCPVQLSLLESALESELQEEKAEKLTLIDLVRHPRLRTNILCCCFVWFINALTYFALVLTSGSLTDNVYLGFFLNVVVEVPSCFIVMVGIEKIGRKKTLFLLHLIAAVALMSSGAMRYFQDNSGLQIGATVMSLVGKLGISGSFNCIFFYTPEMFPTNIRNQAIGTGSTAARIGGMIAPYTGLLAEKVIWAPGAIFGVCNLLVLLLIHKLPESMGRELPQNLADLELWYSAPASKPSKNKTSKETRF